MHQLVETSQSELYAMHCASFDFLSADFYDVAIFFATWCGSRTNLPRPYFILRLLSGAAGLGNGDYQQQYFAPIHMYSFAAAVHLGLFRPISACRQFDLFYLRAVINALLKRERRVKRYFQNAPFVRKSSKMRLA